MILRPSMEQQKGLSRRKAFCLPYFVGDRANGNVTIEVKSHLICKAGLNTLLSFGQKRCIHIMNAAKSLAVLPKHKRIGTMAQHAIPNNERKYEPLVRHFEYLKNLSEV